MAKQNVEIASTSLEQQGVLKPPVTAVGFLGWARNNLFNSWYNTVLTLLGLLFIYFAVTSVVNFIVHTSHDELVVPESQYRVVTQDDGALSLQLQNYSRFNAYNIQVFVEYVDNGVAKVAQGVVDIASGRSSIHRREGGQIVIEPAGIALDAVSDGLEITQVRTVFNRWAVIPSNLTLLMVGRYPQNMLERPWLALVFVAFMLGLSAGVWGGLVRQIAALAATTFVVFLFFPFENNPRDWLTITILTGGVAYLLARFWPKFKTWSESLGVTQKLLPSFGAVCAVAAVPLAAWLLGAFNSELSLDEALNTPERLWSALLLAGFVLGLNGGVWRGIWGVLTLAAVATGVVGMLFVIVLSIVPLQGILTFVTQLSGDGVGPVQWVMGHVIAFLMALRDFVFIELLPGNFDKISFWGLMLVVSVAYAWGRNVLTLKNLAYLGWALTLPAAMAVIGGIGSAWLPEVNTRLWGGLMLTMLLSVVGIVLSLPLGILLALGRRSQFPVVSGFCVLYIELIRGVPLITILFMANIMIPLLLPGSDIENVFSAMAGIMLFSAAYMAENVRGGLQAIPSGQFEAGYAVGLNGWQSTILITLPQALRTVIPAIVGQAIALFKDTTLVSIIGLFDFLLIGQAVINNRYWLGLWDEILFFVAIIYWIFCYGMSYVSRRIEASLGVGER